MIYIDLQTFDQRNFRYSWHTCTHINDFAKFSAIYKAFRAFLGIVGITNHDFITTVRSSRTGKAEDVPLKSSELHVFSLFNENLHLKLEETPRKPLRRDHLAKKPMLKNEKDASKCIEKVYANKLSDSRSNMGNNELDVQERKTLIRQDNQLGYEQTTQFDEDTFLKWIAPKLLSSDAAYNHLYYLTFITRDNDGYKVEASIKHRNLKKFTLAFVKRLHQEVFPNLTTPLVSLSLTPLDSVYVFETATTLKLSISEAFAENIIDEVCSVLANSTLLNYNASPKWVALSYDKSAHKLIITFGFMSAQIMNSFCNYVAEQVAL